MNEQIKEMVKKLLALKGRAPDAFTVKTWCEVLERFDVKDVARACGACMQKAGFFEISDLLNELQPDNKTIAAEEWSKCLTVARNGGNGYKDLSTPTKTALRLSGGLTRLRFTESDYTLNNMRNIFLETFDINTKQIAFDSDSKSYKFVEGLADKKAIK